MLTQQEARPPLAGTSPRPLVICVDDAAQDEAVTEAVLQLAAAGRISATSAMVQAPGWPAQARSLAAESRIDLGLHLNFTQPFPEASAWPLSQVMRRAWLRGFARDWLEAQIDAQIEAFANHAGRLPDHIDGHQHVHQFPQIREALLARMAHWWHGAARRPWLRCTLPAPGAA
ncbi:MAG TPA: ChbG/HpnK family deacetylase, partial [Methylibium sp.]